MITSNYSRQSVWAGQTDHSDWYCQDIREVTTTTTSFHYTIVLNTILTKEGEGTKHLNSTPVSPLSISDNSQQSSRVISVSINCNISPQLRLDDVIVRPWTRINAITIHSTEDKTCRLSGLVVL